MKVKLLACAVAALMMTACATRQESGALIGAGAGAIIGNQFGSGVGRVAATAAGAVVGGLIGSEIGRSLDEEDRRMAMEAEYYALEEEEIGRPRKWRNPRNGRYGHVKARKAYTYNGRRCREFEHTIYIDGRPETMTGKACRQPDGTWKQVA